MDVKYAKLLCLGDDGIYSTKEWGSGQEQELVLRKLVAERAPSDLILEISIHHSFSVMDREVKRFLQKLPQGATILDVGGCWGWHWRNISKVRPDIKVVIMDFVRENLEQSRYFLSDQINKNIFLVHGDGTKIPFEDQLFDGYWAVQTLQHIPVLENALTEAKRVLKPGGCFTMYNLNNPKAIRTLYKALKRKWVDQGVIEGMYFFRRSGKRDADLVEKVFGNVSPPRFTEVLFTPELNLHRPAKPDHWLGWLDARLSSSFWVWSLVARQCAYSAVNFRE